jgi:hypothetical protein
MIMAGQIALGATIALYGRTQAAAMAEAALPQNECSGATGLVAWKQSLMSKTRPVEADSRSDTAPTSRRVAFKAVHQDVAPRRSGVS